MRAALLRWYDRNKRDLPWRGSRDPYAIWVSETMLQQTQVATVLPYYHRFMKAFPSVEALDRASLDAVRSVWSGLGYYRRAENLKRAARLVVSRHGGRLPADYQALLRPAGNRTVYTAGAIMSIAFDRRYPGTGRQPAAGLCAPAPPDGPQGNRPIRRSQMVSRLASRRLQPGGHGAGRHHLPSRGAALRTLPVCPTGATRGRPEPSTYRGGRPMRTRAVQLAIGVRGIAIADSASPPSRRGPAGRVSGSCPRRRHCRPGIADETLRQSDPVAVIRHAITDMRITAPVYVLRRRVAVKGPDWRWVGLDDLRSHPLSSLSTPRPPARCSAISTLSQD